MNDLLSKSELWAEEMIEELEKENKRLRKAMLRIAKGEVPDAVCPNECATVIDDVCDYAEVVLKNA